MIQGGLKKKMIRFFVSNRAMDPLKSRDLWTCVFEYFSDYEIACINDEFPDHCIFKTRATFRGLWAALRNRMILYARDRPGGLLRNQYTCIYCNKLYKPCEGCQLWTCECFPHLAMVCRFGHRSVCRMCVSRCKWCSIEQCYECMPQCHITNCRMKLCDKCMNVCVECRRPFCYKHTGAGSPVICETCHRVSTARSNSEN